MFRHKYTPEEHLAAFWQKINKEGSIHPYIPNLGKCWLWIAGCNKKGYGNVSNSNGSQLAHRLMWKIINGEIPKGLEVCHSCDVRNCVNPEHLYLGTHKQNMEDMSKRARYADTTGEKHNMHKLKDVQVIEIRERYAMGGISQRKLAHEYGLTQSSIWAIIHSKTWSCVG